MYRRILKTARVSDLDEHMVHIRDPELSDGMPAGRASDGIYGSILNDRTFDAYGRAVPDEDRVVDRRAVARRPVHRDLLDVKAEEMERAAERLGAARMKEEEEAAEQEERRRRADGTRDGDEEEEGDFDRSEEDEACREGKTTRSPIKKKLITPAWKIGRKPTKYGPPGLAPPIRGVSNSEGNEKFFNYDGEWKDGHMDGQGVYRFDDGYTHEGVFRRNVPDGRGKAVYPGGTVYIGEWKAGYPHGRGHVSYGCGVVYDGMWRDGKRDGSGVLTFPNGSKYEGQFRGGKYHGRGTFISKRNGMTYEGRFQRGYVSGRGTIDYGAGRPRVTRDWPEGSETGLTLHDAIAKLEREREEAEEAKEREREALLGPVRMTKLEGYLKKVRSGLAARRKKERNDAVEERRRTIREMRAKELERLSSAQEHY